MKSALLIDFLRRRRTNELKKLNTETYPWELLIRQSRRANLISRIAQLLLDAEILDSIPVQPRQHFINSLCLAKANARATHWEVQDIHNVLKSQNIDFILLKGSAYIWTKNSASKGRLFNDVDIMVRESSLADAEKKLIHSGWMTSSLDTYDQRYYRQWMHEIPPLRHLKRQTTLDLHHSIIPPISHSGFSAAKLWQQTTAIKGMPNLYTLSNIDMILHSATHLFHEGEFDQGLRDLSDMDLLIEEYILKEALWDNLLARAAELNLEIPLYYALNYTRIILHTAVPEDVICKAAKQGKLGRFHNQIMDYLFLKALAPNHETCKTQGAAVAKFLLFIRSHWIRMPWHLLLPHLTRKAWIGLKGGKT